MGTIVGIFANTTVGAVCVYDGNVKKPTADAWMGDKLILTPQIDGNGKILGNHRYADVHKLSDHYRSAVYELVPNNDSIDEIFIGTPAVMGEMVGRSGGKTDTTLQNQMRLAYYLGANMSANFGVKCLFVEVGANTSLLNVLSIYPRQPKDEGVVADELKRARNLAWCGLLYHGMEQIRREFPDAFDDEG